MKEDELTNELAVRLNWEKQDVETMLIALGQVVAEKLSDNNIVSIYGLGQFEARLMRDHIKHNPINGVTYMIPPKWVARYKPASAIKNFLKTLDA